jgi:hypothetical protein
VSPLLATSSLTQAQTPVERGSYLVNGLLTCGNCHTPRGPGGDFAMDKQLSGGPQEWDRPTYKVRGANIMPDKETGIGNWSEAEWRAARPDHALWLLQGLHRERSSPFALPVSPNVVDPDYCSPRKQAFDRGRHPEQPAIMPIACNEHQSNRQPARARQRK